VATRKRRTGAKESALKDKIRWGILGTGGISGKFARALTFIPDAKLVAVGSRAQSSADDFARQHHVPYAHGSYQALVEDPNVDVVYVGTLNSWHHKNCLAALQAGKPVLCEKPFTVNSKEAEEVISLAHEKKLFLMEALWTRFIPAFIKARQMWESGVIGEVRVCMSELSFIIDRTPPANPFNADLAGGTMLDMGPYPISMAHLLFGEPDTIASLAHIGDTGVDEQTGLLFGYSGGQLALGYTSFNVQSPIEATVVGTKGTIRIHSPFFCPPGFTLYLNGEEAKEFNVPYEGNGWNYEAVEVMHCLRSGKLESEVVPHRETLAIMRTMDRIRDQIGLKYPFEK
jgi:dihydrodiol dehydrogenase / D-xylose 1-dehydrogenase (NADP)